MHLLVWMIDAAHTPLLVYPWVPRTSTSCYTKTCDDVTKTCDDVTKTCDDVTKTCDDEAESCDDVPETRGRADRWLAAVIKNEWWFRQFNKQVASQADCQWSTNGLNGYFCFKLFLVRRSRGVAMKYSRNVQKWLQDMSELHFKICPSAQGISRWDESFMNLIINMTSSIDIIHILQRTLCMVTKML